MNDRDRDLHAAFLAGFISRDASGGIVPRHEHLTRGEDAFRREHGHSPATKAECGELWRLAQANALRDGLAKYRETKSR